jgi:hypothetical protein
MVTDPLEIEEEGLVLRQTAARHLPGFVPREAGLVDAFYQGAHQGRRILIDVHKPPFLVRGNVPDRRLANLGARVENGHPFKHPVRSVMLPSHSDVPHLFPGVHLFDELGNLHVVELGMPTIGLALHVV